MPAYDLSRFGLKEMTDCGADLRRMDRGQHSMEQAATRVVRYLYDGLVDGGSGRRACALVRVFKTHPWEQLDGPLQQFAQRLAPDQRLQGVSCLTLLASAGDKPEWNVRQRSQGHQAIPLTSEQAVSQAPMIATLIRQMGLEIRTVLKPDEELLVDLDQHAFNVFHVPEAAGSPYIPGQREFVVPCGIQSVLGFGGLLPLGTFFAVILFTKRSVAREVAELFKPLALSVKIALLPFEDAVFDGGQG
jgi:hypothetical protein